jgi:SAM-dependent methyltransferase
VTAKTPGDEWFRDWFGEDYLDLYPHRDGAEAREAVDLFLAAVDLPAGPVLDLACGAGRHLRELEQRGVEAVGLDLSWVLLGEARAAMPGVPLVRADMRRIPLADGSMAGVASFFTSFGYFRDPADDRRVLEEIRRVMRGGGHWLLDFIHAARVRRELVLRDERQTGDTTVTQTRAIDDDAVVKTIHIRSPGEETRTFRERVRLYSESELSRLLEDAGLVPVGRYGDYAGGPFGPDADRLIFTGSVA